MAATLQLYISLERQCKFVENEICLKFEKKIRR